MIKTHFLLLLRILSGSEGRVVRVLGLCFILFSLGDLGWWTLHRLEIVGYYGGEKGDENDTPALKNCHEETCHFIDILLIKVTWRFFKMG